MPELETILVVGASLAGVRTVQALRREGHTGRIVLVGAETHWPPFDRPPLSKQVLTGAWEPDKARLRLPDPFDADLVLGRTASALALGGGRGRVTLDDGTPVDFDGLVVATGAVPITLPGTDGVRGVHVLRSVDDCLALRHDLDTARRVAIVGGGVIGCEVASSCRSLGLDVTLVEFLDVPLVRVLGTEMGRVAAALHEANGVDLRLGTRVLAVEAGTAVERLELSDGTTIEADVVVIGVGVRPATAWLDGSGLTVDDGVVCDESLVAVGSGGTVVAAGDVARWWHPQFDRSIRVEHWTNASDQAAHAAKVLVHGAEAAGGFAPVPYFWSDQHGTKFQLVGTTGRHDVVSVVEGGVADGRFVATYECEGTIVGALCVNWPARMLPWRQVIEARSPAGTLP